MPLKDMGCLVQLQYLDAAAGTLEWPLTVLRRATIPLLERESYSRPWFLTSLVSGQVTPLKYKLLQRKCYSRPCFLNSLVS